MTFQTFCNFYTCFIFFPKIRQNVLWCRIRISTYMYHECWTIYCPNKVISVITERFITVIYCPNKVISEITEHSIAVIYCPNKVVSVITEHSITVIYCPNKVISVITEHFIAMHELHLIRNWMVCNTNLRKRKRLLKSSKQ